MRTYLEDVKAEAFALARIWKFESCVVSREKLTASRYDWTLAFSPPGPDGLHILINNKSCSEARDQIKLYSTASYIAIERHDMRYRGVASEREAAEAWDKFIQENGDRLRQQVSGLEKQVELLISSNDRLSRELQRAERKLAS